MDRIGTSTMNSYFEGITLGADMRVGGNHHLLINDTLQLDGANIILWGGSGAAGFASLAGSTESSFTSTDLNLTGTGNIVMTGASQLSANLNSHTLRIGSGIDILIDNRKGRADAQLRGGVIENNTTITVDGDFSYLDIVTNKLINNGLVHATNQGEVDLMFDASSSVSSTQLDALHTSNDGSISIRGIIDNNGATLALGGTSGGNFAVRGYGSDSSDYSRIVGGRVETGTGDPLFLRFTYLDNVTLAGEVSGKFAVVNDIAMDGGRVLLDVGDDVLFAGGQTISGLGKIEINDTVYNSPNDLQIGDGTGTVVFGPDITLHSIRGMRNDIKVNQFENQGTILLDSLEFPYATDINGSMTNAGLIHLRSGSARLIGNGLASPIINQGEIIAESNTDFTIRDGFENTTGLIRLRENSKLTYMGEYSSGAFGTIINEGGEFELRGTLDLQAQNFDFDELTEAGQDKLELTSDFGIRNGTLSSSSNTLLAFDKSTQFENVTFASDATFYGASYNRLNGNITIADGASLFLGLVPQGVADSDRVTLRLGTSASSVPVINGPGEIIIVGGAGDPKNIVLDTNYATLALGPDLTVRTDGGAFTLSAINQGLVQVNHPGDILYLQNRYAGQFHNDGVIDVNAGQLRIGDLMSLDSLGTININQSSEVWLVGTLDLQGQTLNIDGQWSFNGSRNANTSNATLMNGRLETTSQPMTLSGDYFGELDKVTLAGEILVEQGGNFRLLDGLVMDGGRLQIGGSGDVYAIADNFNFSGSGEIVFTGNAPGTNELIFYDPDRPRGIIRGLSQFGAGVVVRTGGDNGIIRLQAQRTENLGRISADENVLTIFSASELLEFHNTTGVLEAKNNGQLFIYNPVGDIGTLSFINGGTITLGPDRTQTSTTGGNYRLSENLTLGHDELLNLNGMAEIGSIINITADGRLVINDVWTNTGTLNVQSGGELQIKSLPIANGTLNLDGEVILNGLFTTPDLLTLPLGNADVEVSTTGAIDNTGSTLEIGTNVAALGLHGGKLEGGVVTQTTNEKLIVDSTNGTSQIVDALDLQADIDLIAANLIIDASKWTGQVNVNANTHLFLQGTDWDNAGGVFASDALVTIAGTSSTLGTFDLLRSILNVDSINTAANFQSAITATESELRITDNGEVNNTGNTIVLDETTLVWSLAHGSLTGGQVQANATEHFHVAGGYVDGVEISALVELSGSGLVKFDNSTIASAGVLFSNPFNSSTLLFTENQDFTGFGNITFGTGSNLLNQLLGPQPLVDWDGTVLGPAVDLILPADQIIRAEAGGQGTVSSSYVGTINRGTLQSTGLNSYLKVLGTPITNDGGLFSAIDNGTLELDGLTGDLGQAVVHTGGTLIINGDYIINQPLTMADSTFSLDGNWSARANVSLQDSTLIWETLPTSGDNFFLLSNSTISIATPFTSNDLPSSFGGGSNAVDVRSGGSFDLLGEIFNTDTTPLALSGGTMRNGQISGSSANPIQITATSKFDGISFSAVANITEGSTLHAINALVNAGRITNNGGTLRADGEFTNTGGATVTGYGDFDFFGQVQSLGDMQFNGGDSTVSGIVTNTSGALVSTAGEHTTIFNDEFINQAGAEVHTSEGSSTIFLDLVEGAGNFSGTGNVVFNRGFSPGSSPSVVQFDGNVELVNSFRNTLFIEIGGASSGEHDRLNVSGDLLLGGRLFVSMIDGFQLAEGQQFIIAEVDGDTRGTFLFAEQDSRVGIYNDVDLYIDYKAGDGNDLALYSLPGLVLGDLNGDGVLTNGDIAPFVQALTDPAGYQSTFPELDADELGDFTADGVLTNGDIAGFVNALTGDTTNPVPEPTSLALLGATGLMLTRRLR